MCESGAGGKISHCFLCGFQMGHRIGFDDIGILFRSSLWSEYFILESLELRMEGSAISQEEGLFLSLCLAATVTVIVRIPLTTKYLLETSGKTGLTASMGN